MLVVTIGAQTLFGDTSSSCVKLSGMFHEEGGTTSAMGMVVDTTLLAGTNVGAGEDVPNTFSAISFFVALSFSAYCGYASSCADSFELQSLTFKLLNHRIRAIYAQQFKYWLQDQTLIQFLLSCMTFCKL